jgi:hypothetical protein
MEYFIHYFFGDLKKYLYLHPDLRKIVAPQGIEPSFLEQKTGGKTGGFFA